MKNLLRAYKRERSATVRQIKATNTLAKSLNEAGEFIHNVTETDGDYVPVFEQIEIEEAAEQIEEEITIPVEPDEQDQQPRPGPSGEEPRDEAEIEEEEEDKKKKRREFRTKWDYKEGFKKFAMGNNRKARQYSSARRDGKLDIRSRTALMRTQTPLFVCTFIFCGQVRTSVEGIRAHCMRHSGKCWRCPDCNTKYYNSNQYDACVRSHKEKTASVSAHTCPICDKDFKDKGSLRKHRYAHAKTPGMLCLLEGCASPKIQFPTDKTRHFKNWHKMKSGVTKDMFIKTPEQEMEYYTREEHEEKLRKEQEEEQ